MKCFAQVKKGKKNKRCNKECSFFYCKEHWKTQKKKITALVIFVVAFVAFAANYKSISSWWKPEHNRFIEDTYYVEKLLPFITYDSVEINCGGTDIKLWLPPSGVDVPSTKFFVGCTKTDSENKTKMDEGFAFDIKIKDGFLWLSLDLRDFHKPYEEIASLQNNRWYIHRDIKNYYPKNQAFEIEDKYNNVLFQLWVDKANVIQVRGYFTGNYCTYFCNGSVMK